jgi:SDR family mycofactocin-dependent oxidoreductase
MADRVVLVTGAARGIGAATVRRLLADGCQVLAVDSCEGQNAHTPYPLATRDDLEQVVSGSRGAAVAHVADVRDRAAIEDGAKLALERWGRLDGVVAAAAVIAGGMPLWETGEDQLHLLWDVNVNGVWNTAAATIPTLLQGPYTRHARFVAVASAAGAVGLHHLAAYNAAKHAVVGLVKGLAADLIGTGVTACAVSPGSTRTDMLEATARLYGMQSIEDFAAHQLMGRLLTPEEVASAVAYCTSPDSVVNGSVLYADGGFNP